MIGNKVIFVEPRETILSEAQDCQYIRKTILSVLKEEKVSLSQARTIFNDILVQIEDSNVITLDID